LLLLLTLTTASAAAAAAAADPHNCCCCCCRLSQAQADHVDREAGEQALMLSRMLTMQDPFQGFPFTTMPGVFPLYEYTI
jgi:hypothetical protein